MGRAAGDSLIARRQVPDPPPRLVLDAGAVIALTRGDTTIRARLRQAVRDHAEIVVPPVVVTQTVRGGRSDAPINQLLKAVEVPPVDLSLARLGGYLLAAAGTQDAADAQIVAEALRRLPVAILTSDPDDMARLVGGQSGIQIVSI